MPNSRPGGWNTAAAFWHVLVGPPLRARDITREQITPVEGLSALSLDALTSVAYGPEAIIVVLALAGASALHLVLPVTVAIVVLLALLVFSYRQVIEAYPQGGGAYAVSRDNLGPRASLLAATALVVDYTLTVAVSIAAGTQALTSAFPGLASATVPICLAILGQARRPIRTGHSTSPTAPVRRSGAGGTGPAAGAVQCVLPDDEAVQALWRLGPHGHVRHQGQARAMPRPVQQAPHVLGRPFEDGLNPAIVAIAHPPGHTALPGHPLAGSAEVDALDLTGDQHPIADHMPTLTG